MNKTYYIYEDTPVLISNMDREQLEKALRSIAPKVNFSHFSNVEMRRRLFRSVAPSSKSEIVFEE